MTLLFLFLVTQLWDLTQWWLFPSWSLSTVQFSSVVTCLPLGIPTTLVSILGPLFVDQDITFLTRHLVLLSPSHPLSLLHTQKVCLLSTPLACSRMYSGPLPTAGMCHALTIVCHRPSFQGNKTVSWPGPMVEDVLQAPIHVTALTVSRSATQIYLALCRPQNRSGNKLRLPSLGLIPLCAVPSCK